MICCKIIADYNNPSGDFDKLISKLTKYGDFLWDSNNLFFGDIENDLTEKKIGKILKQCGYDKFYINVYSQYNQPQESDFINGWLTDRIVRINYKQCEDESQKVFHDIAIGLAMLNKELDELKSKAQKQEEKEEESNE